MDAQIQTEAENTVTEAISQENVTIQEAPAQKSEGFETIQLEEEKPKRVPRRVIHFSDGIVEEYSTDEEDDEVDSKPVEPPVDPKSLAWMPYIWYYTVASAMGALGVCDFLGEKLAWFFGITQPKYQYAINEYYRNLREEEEDARRAKEEFEEEQREVTEKQTETLSKLEGGVEDEVDITS
ncbi:protein FAM177A1-like [Glandiceps talaboti]